MLNARSQERLIGGKKPTITITQQPPQAQQQIPMMQMQTILQKPQLQQTLSQPPLIQSMNQSSFDSHSMEKLKRNVMKTQATQTEVCPTRKANQQQPQTLSLSPRTVHRVSFFFLQFFYLMLLFISIISDLFLSFTTSMSAAYAD